MAVELLSSLAVGMASSSSPALLDGSGAVDRGLLRKAAAFNPQVLMLPHWLFDFSDGQFVPFTNPIYQYV